MMNIFGRKKKITATSAVIFTSATEITNSPPNTTVSPPAIAFQHSRDSQQTISIELTPSDAVNTRLEYDSTMKGLHDFHIDDDTDNSSFDDVEFGEQLVNAATVTAHVEKESKKILAIWVISGIVFVGVCVGLIAAIAVNESGLRRGTSNGASSLQVLDAANQQQQGQTSLSYLTDSGQEWNASFLFNNSGLKNDYGEFTGVP